MRHQSFRRKVQVTVLSLLFLTFQLTDGDSNTSTSTSTSTTNINPTSSVVSTTTASINSITSSTLSTNTKIESQTASAPNVTAVSPASGTQATAPAFSTGTTTLDRQTSITSSTLSTSAKGSTPRATPALTSLVSSTVITKTTSKSPDAVTNLTISSKNQSSVSLSWNLPNGNSYSYRIQWTNGSVHTNDTTSNTSYTVSGLTPGVNYTFSVTAVAADGLTAGTPVYISAFTNPDVVTNLSISSKNQTSVSVSWNLPYGNSSSYRIQWTNGNVPNNHTTSDTSYTVNGLTPGVNYTFSVTAVAADGQTAGAPVYISAFTNPDVITNLIIANKNTSSVSLMWNLSNVDSSSYRIQWTNGNVPNNHTTSDTFYTVTALTPGVNYTFSVTAVAADGLTAGAPVYISAFTNPDVVTNLSISSKKQTSVSVSWSLPNGNSYSYRIQWTNGSVHINDTTSNTSYRVNGLTPGVNYTFSVTAVAADGQTAGAPVYISAFTIPDVINLSILDKSTSSVSLKWNLSNGDSSYYIIQWTNGNVPNSHTTSDTSYTVNGLTPGVNYTFSVTAVAADGQTAGTPVYISVFTIPDVINLSILDKSTSSVSLMWNLSNGDSSYYRIQWTNGNVPNNHTTSDTSYTVSGLTPGVNYTFSVTAVAADGETAGAPVYISAFTKPDIVRNLTTEVTTNTIFMNWTEPIGQRSFFKVQWTCNNATLNITTTNTFYNITGLSPGVKCDSAVSAIAGDNLTEGKSIPVSTYTKPDIVRNLTIEVTTNTIFMNWTEPIGQRSFFKVQWTCNKATLNITTTNTFYNITGLIPGEKCDSEVSAIAGDNLTEGESIPVSTYTKPDIIRNLNVFEVTSTSVYLNWTEPTGERSFFKVICSNDSIPLNEVKTGVTYSNITGLIPGLSYSFKVSTFAADNVTEGKAVDLSKCTNASPVREYTCEAPNRTALLNITWNIPIGYNQGFNISLDGVSHVSFKSCQSQGLQNLNNTCNGHIQDLQYSKKYSLSIVTLGCGQSDMLSFTCKTGFTEPTVPTLHFVKINESFQDAQKRKVIIQLNDSILDDSKGLIEAYGVLLSTGIGSNSSDFLKKNYSDWKKDSTMTYLTVLSKVESTRTKSSVINTIQIEIGNAVSISGTKYINEPLDTQTKYSAALVLFTSLKITEGLVDTTYSFFSVSPFVTLLEAVPNSNNNDIIWAVLAVILVIIIIVIIFLVFIRQKRRTKKNETEIPVNILRNKVSIPVRVEDYEAYFKKQQADSNCGFAEEYEDLKVVGTAQVKISALALDNKGKNRYNNVLPYDFSRVKLSIHGSPFDDYINANYIPGYNSKKEYIAAQGPLPVTVNEFWRMIWEKHVQTIVMLTKCNEQGRVKCEKYWPSETKLYNNIIVTTTSEISLEDWTIRDFTIKNVKTAETREVRHFHFTAWPDHGVPETTEVLINFRHLVREHMDHYSRNSPTIVHCSAGVGRTGTFIALDHLIFQIERDSMVDIYGIVHNMRMHRPLMVQTEDQYVFLNQCAVDIIKSRMGTNVDLIYQNAAAFSVYGNL